MVREGNKDFRIVRFGKADHEYAFATPEVIVGTPADFLEGIVEVAALLGSSDN